MRDTPELLTEVFKLYHEHIQGQRPEDVAALTAYPPKTQAKWEAYTKALAELFADAPPVITPPEQHGMLAPTPAQRARIQAMGCRLTWDGTRADLEVSGADPRMGAALDCSPRGAVVRLWEEFITGLEKDLAAQRKGPG